MRSAFTLFRERNRVYLVLDLERDSPELFLDGRYSETDGEVSDGAPVLDGCGCVAATCIMIPRLKSKMKQTDRAFGNRVSRPQLRGEAIGKAAQVLHVFGTHASMLIS